MASSASAPPEAKDSTKELFASMNDYADSELRAILTGFQLALQQHEFEQLLPYSQRLNEYIRLDYPLPLSVRIEIIRFLYGFVGSAQGREADHKVFTVVVGLLNTLFVKELHVDQEEVPEAPKLELDWSAAHDLLYVAHFGRQEHPADNGSSSQNHVDPRLAPAVELARWSRDFFPESATVEILDFHRQQLSKHNPQFHQTFALLCLFLPTNFPEQCSRWLNELAEAYEWFENCPDLTECWLSLLSRASLFCHPSLLEVPFHSEGKGGESVPNTPYSLAYRVLTRALDSFQAQPQQKQFLKPFLSWKGLLPSDNQSLSNLIVSVLTSNPAAASDGGEGKSVRGVLSQFLTKTLSTRFHPSNQGPWSGPLFEFLADLISVYTRRKLYERKIASGWKRSGMTLFNPGTIELPPVPALSSEDDAWFVDLVLPLCIKGLYSKKEFVVSTAASSLSDLCFLQPALLPELLGRFAADLASYDSAHRTASAFRALSAMAFAIVAHLARRLQKREVDDPDYLGVVDGRPGSEFEGDEDAWDDHLGETLRLVSNLLIGSLPGIDSADEKKTLLTLRWIRDFFSYVPLHTTPNPSTAPEAILAFSAVLEEFHPQFLSRILSFLSLKEDYAQEDRNFLLQLTQTLRVYFSAMPSALFQSSLQCVLDYVTAQSYPANKEFFGVVLFAASSADPKASLDTAFDLLYRKLMASSGKQPAKDSLRSDLSEDQIQWFSHLIGNVVYFSDQAEATLRVLPQIRTLYQSLQGHKKWLVRQQGGVIFSNFLRSLTAVYCVDYRPFTSSQWPQNPRDEADWAHWNLWGSWQGLYPTQGSATKPWIAPMVSKRTVAEGFAYEYLDPHVQWHIPTPSENSAAAQLVLDCLRAPVDVLLAAAAPDFPRLPPSTEGSLPDTVSSEASDDEPSPSRADALEKALSQIAMVLDNAANLLGGWSSGPQNKATKERTPVADGADPIWVTAADTSETKYPEARNYEKGIPLFRSVPAILQLLPTIQVPFGSDESVPLRVYFLRLLHHFLHSAVLVQSDQSLHPTVQHTLPKLFERLVLFSHLVLKPGAGPQDLAEEKMLKYQIANAQHSSKWTGFGCTTRHLLVSRAQQLMFRRITNGIQADNLYTADVKRCLTDVGRLILYSTSQNARMSSALLLAESVDSSHPLHAKVSLDQFLSFLRNLDPDAEDQPTSEQISMAIRGVGAVGMSPSLRDWDRISDVILTICRSAPIHESPTVQAEFKSLFDFLITRLSGIPLYTPPVLPQPSLDDQDRKNRNQAIQLRNSHRVAAQKSLISQLLDILSLSATPEFGSELHWRYQIIGSAFLGICVRAGPLNMYHPGSDQAAEAAALASLSDTPGTAQIFLPTQDAIALQAGVVKHFAECLTNSLRPLQGLASNFLSRWLQTHRLVTRNKEQELLGSASGPEDPLDPFSLRSQSKFASTKFTALDEHQFQQKIWDSSPDSSNSPGEIMADSVSEGWRMNEAPRYDLIGATPHTGHYSHTGAAVIPSTLGPLKMDQSSRRTTHFDLSLGVRVAGEIHISPFHPPAADALFSHLSKSISTLLKPRSGDGDRTKLFVGLLELAFSRIQSATPEDPASSASQFVTLFMQELENLTAEHHERDHQVLAAQIWSATITALKHHLGLSVGESCRATLQKCLEMVAGKCQSDSVPGWLDAIRQCSQDSDPRRLAWLRDFLSRKLFGDGSSSAADTAAEQTPSERVRHTQMLVALIQKLSWRSARFSSRILEQLLESEENTPAKSLLRSPYDAVRRETGRLIAQCLSNQDRVSAWPLPADEPDRRMIMPSLTHTQLSPPAARVAFLKLVDAVLGSIHARPADGLAESAADRVEQDKFFLETLAFTTLRLLELGYAQFAMDFYTAVLPHFLRLTSHPDQTTSSVCGACVYSLASGVQSLTPTRLAEWVERIRPVLESEISDWHPRGAALFFLTTLLPRFSLLLDTDPAAPAWSTKTLLQLAVARLSDPALEARQAASELLTACIMSCRTEDVGSEALIRKLSKKAMTPLPAKGGGAAGAEARQAALLRRHSGVLGLVAFVAAFPYEVPSFLPAVLERLTQHIQDPAPIGGTHLRAVFDNFTRTHQDEWESKFVHLFTQSQLDALSSFSTQSYFA